MSHKESEKQHFCCAACFLFSSFFLPPSTGTLSQTLHIQTLARDVQNKYEDGDSADSAAKNTARSRCLEVQDTLIVPSENGHMNTITCVNKKTEEDVRHKAGFSHQWVCSEFGRDTDDVAPVLTFSSRCGGGCSVLRLCPYYKQSHNETHVVCKTKLLKT